MKSTRRSFLSFLGGGAVAGPGALKKAMASAVKSGALGDVSTVTGLGFNPPQGEKNANSAWIARDILDLVHRRNGPTVQYSHQVEYPDLQALKSVSATFKARKTLEKNMDAQVARQLGNFIKEHKLNWVGLTEERLLSIVKQAAGE